ncbi:FitA-like ribbon-helix-helix domain-containing protein [Pelodictyon phaeoclathratiforme]|jgi:plasmid stability protein|uniref:Antitoxin FitA-like ribbon-helix-helix domain-containing protein n=1 Tax=Pelodictyon phaeoclathratiforme (strain DSM 5477 / BU-1) TaxID=324925 RepID=B4SEM3_PELPB|nr:hypothetical protein [Pelodictyon phaeoclathratiforme]ACF43115.1 conserved hypothetical protein [Pelodictyon phaeoclathratiforme BU-1]MBV5289919.1 toxin-antitoxin system [Pelodictyon phaeoclathratiforme]
MTQVIVCNIDDDENRMLELRAARHGWSIEEEVRQILRRAVSEEDQAQRKTGSRIAARFTEAGLTEPLNEFRRNIIKPIDFGS